MRVLLLWFGGSTLRCTRLVEDERDGVWRLTALMKLRSSCALRRSSFPAGAVFPLRALIVEKCSAANKGCWVREGAGPTKKDGTDGWNGSSNGEFRHCLADLGLG